jgi:hypothetical protein
MKNRVAGVDIVMAEFEWGNLQPMAHQKVQNAS